MFFEFGIKDFIDILLVAFLLYYTYKLMKASGSINVFTGILVFILIWLVVSQVLEMKLLGSIFDKLSVWVCWHLSSCFRMKYGGFCLRSVRISMPVHWCASLRETRKKAWNTMKLCPL